MELPAVWTKNNGRYDFVLVKRLGKEFILKHSMYLFENTLSGEIKDSKDKAEKFRTHLNDLEQKNSWIILGYDLGEKASKGYAVVQLKELGSLMMELKNNRRKNLCFYHMIIPSESLFLFLDLEYETSCNKDKNEFEMVKMIKELIIECIQDHFEVIIKEEDFILERSSNEVKVSWHLFLPNFVMKDCFEMGELIKFLVNSIMECAKNGEKKEEWMKYTPLIIKKKKSEEKFVDGCFIDDNIYRSHGLFRIVENSKFGKERYFVPFDVEKMEERKLDSEEELQKYIETVYFHNVSPNFKCVDLPDSFKGKKRKEMKV